MALSFIAEGITMPRFGTTTSVPVIIISGGRTIISMMRAFEVKKSSKKEKE